MKVPQFVQSLTENQGIAIVIEGDSVEDSGDDFCQYYGPRRFCEVAAINGSSDKCSRDGILWGTSDYNAPCSCTAHTFPLEQTGYEFVEAA